MDNGKVRKPNWSEDEKVILLEEYNKRKHVIKSRFNPQITATKKLQNWEEITALINSRSMVKRTVGEVQKKYENLAVQARKEMSAHRKETMKTGGGGPAKPLSDEAEMVREIMGRESPSVKGGITGGGESGQVESEVLEVADDAPHPSRLSPVKKRMRPAAAAAANPKPGEDLLALQREVLLLQKEKLQLEIQNLDKQGILLQHKLNRLAPEEITIVVTPVEE
ncbi:uncharacterized protein LOC134448290 isoform X1 [Engraulis encrasicolus]|uniref:uncharacterized protein LOC134448290 isoform X1 n=2 Tax=Engraulis encrasicolus TaxID=184585 RepID=UPI002FD1959D